MSSRTTRATRPRWQRTLFGVVVALAATAPAAVGAGPVAADNATTPTTAGAKPATAASKTRVAQLQQQVQAQGDRISRLAEQFDQAVLTKQTADQALMDTQARLLAATAHADEVDRQLRVAAVMAYTRGGGGGVPLVAGAPDEIAIANEYVQVGLGHQHDLLRDAQVVHDEVARERQAAAQASASAALAVQRIEVDRASAQAAVDNQEKLLANARAEIGAAAVDAITSGQPDASADPGAADPAARAAAVPSTGGSADPGATSSSSAATRPARPAPAVAATVAPPSTAAPATTAAPPPAPPRPPATPQPTSAPPPTKAATTTTGTVPKTTLPPAPPAHGASAAVSYARAQLGKPYQWGGAGPDSFDCSGLTMMAWRAGGVSLPHSAAAQYSSIRHVDVKALQAGDLVFFGSDLHHVGIYIGGGQMIEAPYTGANVRIGSIYRSDLFGAGRP